MTSHRLLLLSLSLLIVFVMALSWNQWRRYRQALILREPPRTSEQLVEGEPPDLIISRETTYITEPLTKDGLPDYEAYVWNKYGKGVTPENNAVVPLWRAVGPSDIPEKIRGELFQQLGMEALPLAGDYYKRQSPSVASRPRGIQPGALLPRLRVPRVAVLAPVVE